MEDDAREFLLRVVRSLTAALLWLLVNMILGIYIGLMFFEGSPSAGNLIFYGWLIISLLILVRYYIKIWWSKKAGE
jgi:hypothetical protein